MSDLIHSELAIIVDNGLRNDYRVNYELINNKAYHDKFEGLSGHKAVDEGLYKRSTQMLEHRSGSPYEDIAMLDARTGEVLMENTSATEGVEFQSGLTKSQSEKIMRWENNLRFYTIILTAHRLQGMILNGFTKGIWL